MLATTVLGWVVTSLDLQLSAFLQKQITPDLHAGSAFVGNVFFIFSAGLALGALVLGYFSDLWIGRKRAFMYSIVGTIVMTGVTGFTHAQWQFALVRFLAGVFSGGEWILGLSILSEVAPRRHRSLMLGATHYILRRKVEESPLWEQAVEHKSRRTLRDVRASAHRLFSGRQLGLTLLAIGLFIAIGEPQGTWDFLYPKWYHHLGHQFSGYGITYAYEIAIIVSTLAGGWFMDRVSARWLMPVVWLSVPFTLLIWQTSGPGSALVLQGVFLFLAGFGRQAAWAIVAGYFPVLFPTRLRGTGMGLTWVGGWLLGYTASAAWGPHVQAAAGWSAWWIVQAALLALMPLPMIFAGVETKGKDLDFQEQTGQADIGEADVREAA